MTLAPHVRRIKSTPWLFATLATLMVLGGCSDDKAATATDGGKPPAIVETEITRSQHIDVLESYAGRARGAREVEVRARIQGILEQRLYQEGQVVREGDALFRIDDKPASAQLKGALAQKQQAEANLRQADREWSRIALLFERNAVSERDRDSSLSALELARADLAIAEAGVAAADLDLGYTRVVAPISGVTSLEDLPEGSLVSQGTLLTKLVQQDPIHVRFALPENDAAVQRKARAAMVERKGEQVVDATLIMANGKPYELTGRVDFTASTLDSRTGSVSARAVFPNPENQIIPGQFVRVRLQLRSFEDTVTVAEKAITEGTEGVRVFVVDSDGLAQARLVTLGPVVEGRQVVINGLEANEEVIVSGLVNLRSGARVTVHSGQEGEQ